MKKLFIFLVTLLYLSLASFAYDDKGSYFECHNCSDCVAALNNNTYFEVHLVEDITNQTGTCIDNPANFSNKTFDCLGHTIDGNATGTDYGIYLNGKTNNTIKNCIITEFYRGIYLNSSSNITITNNTANNNGNGIILYSSSYNTITNNTANNNSLRGIILIFSSIDNTVKDNLANNNGYSGITVQFAYDGMNELINNTANNNSEYGIYLLYAFNVTMKNNTMNNNKYNFYAYSYEEFDLYYHDIDTSNTVDGKPIYYWTSEKNAPNGCNNAEINESSNAGLVVLVSCNNITVKNLNLSKNFRGSLLINTTNSKILNVETNSNMRGIELYLAHGNTIANVSSNANNDEGIYLRESSNNTFINVAANTCGGGIYIFYSNNTSLFNATVYNNSYGIRIDAAYNVTLKNVSLNNNTVNFIMQGYSAEQFYYDIDTSNTINGRPIYYWTVKANAPNNCGNAEINESDNPSFVGLISCSNITVKNIKLEKNSYGVLFYNTTNSRILNVSVSNTAWFGIRLTASSNNSLVDITINNNSGAGPYLSTSSNNLIVNSTINNSYVYGIWLDSSSTNNAVTGNNINSNQIGIYISANNNIISNNFISSASIDGITLYSASNNTIIGNYIYNCRNDGISPIKTSWLRIINNTILNTNWSISSHNDTNIYIEGNKVSGNGIYGIGGENGTNVTIINNFINNSYRGIWWYKGPLNNFNISNNIIENSSESAIIIDAAPANNFSIYNNTIANALYGMSLKRMNNTFVFNNIIQDVGTGIQLISLINNTLINNSIINSSLFDISIGSDLTNHTTHNLNISFPISFHGKSINVKRGSSLSKTLERGVKGLRYLNVTNSSASGAWIFVNISYPENEDPSKLFLARWNGSAWETDPSKFTSTYGINTDGKYYYANITNFSLFALFTDQEPELTLVLSSQTIYIGNSITVTCSAEDVSGVAGLNVTSADGTAICSGTNSCSAEYKPSSAGIKTITCTAADSRGNLASSSETLTVYSLSSASFTTVTNTSLDSAIASTNRVRAGQSVSYNLSVAPNIPLITISVTFASALSGISLTASKIAAPPVDVPAAPGIPFAYVNVEKNFKDSDLSSTTLDFKVEKAWIEENGIDPAKVSAYRLENNTWTKLTTTKSGEDDKYIYYSAVSPCGLSIFTISGEKKTVTSPSEEKPPAAEEGAKTSKDYRVIIIIILIALCATIFYFLTRKNLKKIRRR